MFNSEEIIKSSKLRHKRVGDLVEVHLRNSDLHSQLNFDNSYSAVMSQAIKLFVATITTRAFTVSSRSSKSMISRRNIEDVLYFPPFDFLLPVNETTNNNNNNNDNNDNNDNNNNDNNIDIEMINENSKQTNYKYIKRNDKYQRPIPKEGTNIISIIPDEVRLYYSSIYHLSELSNLNNRRLQSSFSKARNNKSQIENEGIIVVRGGDNDDNIDDKPLDCKLNIYLNNVSEHIHKKLHREYKEFDYVNYFQYLSQSPLFQQQLIDNL